MIGLGFLGKASEPMRSRFPQAAMPSVRMKIIMVSSRAARRGGETLMRRAKKKKKNSRVEKRKQKTRLVRNYCR